MILARRGAVLMGALLLLLASIVSSAAAALPNAPARTWGVNGRVTAILPVGDRVFVGGTFSAIVEPSGATHPASNLAVFSASSGAADLSWGGTTDGSVTSLAVGNGVIYLGGAFTTVDGQRRVHIAAVDPATGALSSWKVSANSTVDAVVVSGGAVYIAGNFTKVTDSAGAHTRAYVAKLDATSGALATTWTPAPDLRVRALVPSTDGTRLFLGGDFTTLGRTGTNKVAAVTTSTGALDPAFSSTSNNGSSTAQVFDLTTDGTRLYEAVGGGGGACTAVNAASGAKAWSLHSNGNLHGVRLLGGTVYCGGHFSGTGSFAGQTRSKLAAVDAATGTTLAFAPTINSALGVWTLGVDGSHLFAGGDFTKVGGVTQQHYAEWIDGAQTTVPLPPALSGSAGDRVINLTWQPPTSDGGSKVLRYKLYRHTAGGSYGTPLATLSDTTTTYDDTAVSPGAAYSYVLTAVNAIGESTFSNEVTLTAQSTAQTAPDAPTALAATDVVDGSGAHVARLSWTAPTNTGNSPISNYKVYRGTAAGTETFLADAGAGTSYDDGNVTPQMTYYYTVTAVNGVGEGPPSNESSVSIAAMVPGAPTLTGTAGSSVVSLSWTAPANDGGSPITKYLVTRIDVGRIATVTGTTYDDNSVANGTTYTYKVRAQNLVGNGPYSNTVTLTPGP